MTWVCAFPQQLLTGKLAVHTVVTYELDWVRFPDRSNIPFPHTRHTPHHISCFFYGACICGVVPELYYTLAIEVPTNLCRAIVSVFFVFMFHRSTLIFPWFCPHPTAFTLPYSRIHHLCFLLLARTRLDISTIDSWIRLWWATHVRLMGMMRRGIFPRLLLARETKGRWIDSHPTIS